MPIQLSFLKPVIYLLNVYFKRHNIKQSYFAGVLCVTMFGLSLATVTSVSIRVFIFILNNCIISARYFPYKRGKKNSIGSAETVLQ